MKADSWLQTWCLHDAVRWCSDVEVATEKGSDHHPDGRALRISLPSYTIRTGYGNPMATNVSPPQGVTRGIPSMGLISGMPEGVTRGIPLGLISGMPEANPPEFGGKTSCVCPPVSRDDESSWRIGQRDVRSSLPVQLARRRWGAGYRRPSPLKPECPSTRVMRG